MSFSDGVLFIDSEATGLDVFGDDKTYAITYAMDNDDVKYVDVKSDSLAHFKESLDKSNVVVAHGMKYDAHALRENGIVDLTKYNIDCTIIRAQLLDEHKLNYDLDALTGLKLGIVDELAKMFGGKATKNAQMPNLHRAPREFIERYAKRDIIALRELYRTQEKEKMPKIHSLEKDVLKVLIDMEKTGILVDIEKVGSAIKNAEALLKVEYNRLTEILGKDINVNSSPQMADVLVRKVRKDGRLVLEEKYDKFVAIDGTLINKTDGGAPSFNKDALESMTHPSAKTILKIRKYRKLVDTFLVSQIMGNHKNGRVHPWFNQTRVKTGRLSCNNPNVQAVPKRDPEMKAILRTLFLPEPGYTMLRCDYEQSDVRGFAHYISSTYKGSDRHPILTAYDKDPMTDFHTYVSKLMGIKRDADGEKGANSKQINLAMIFNMGMGKLAKEMGLPYEEKAGKDGKIYLVPGPEAEEVFHLYHSRIPGAADMGKKAASVASNRGHVVSIAGRWLRFPQKWSTYKASGLLYQAFTADLIKMAMVAVSKTVPYLHMQIHDELVCSIDSEDQIRNTKYAMEHVFDDLTKIPIRTVPEIGRNWGKTEKWEDRRAQ